MNFLPGTVEATGPGSVTVGLRGGARVTVPVTANGQTLAPGAEVTLGVRPEDLSATAPGDAALPGKVLVIERLGAESFVYVRTEGGETAVARTDPAARHAPDEPVKVGIRASRCHVFGPDGLALSRAPPAA
jgi:multiple sugar transport system ATP-binding protein